jgi:uncharacterized protein (DUF169 family)
MLGQDDFDVLSGFEFATQPVGVKFLARVPDGMARIDRKSTLCEMLKTAQSGTAFYAEHGDHTCDAGLYVLGQHNMEEQYINGEFGAGLGVFCDARAAARVYSYAPTIAKGIVKYVAFASLHNLSFDPDLLIILANTTQAEILLRASSYKTGEMWQSRYSAVIGCSWLFAYPYLSGKINYTATGLGFGMRRRKLFSEGFFIISIPFDVLPSLLQNLKEMPWIPEPYKPDGLEYVKELRERLELD